MLNADAIRKVRERKSTHLQLDVLSWRPYRKGALSALILLTCLSCETWQRWFPSKDFEISDAENSNEASTLSAGTFDSKAPLGPPSDAPQPRVGMVYIPPGALVVGTPPHVRPRRADRELPGEQLMLDGFYIDQFAFPNEEGAIPITNVSYSDAAAFCHEKGKRLCTELEWERACKGPDNRTYEYGEVYRPETCKTGRSSTLVPSGYNVGCQSDFGVADMHGGPFEWTFDAYGRGYEKGEKVIRGGNGVDGEVVGRCANSEPRGSDYRSGDLGFRCCAGPQNETKVDLAVTHPAGLVPRVRFEDEVERGLIDALPGEAVDYLKVAGKIGRERVWLWTPVANDELHLIALCGRGRPPPVGPRCGLFLARMAPGKVQGLAWVASGAWVANVHRPGPHEMLFLLGGDQRGSFKRLLTYRSGDLSVGELSRGIPKAATKGKKK